MSREQEVTMPVLQALSESLLGELTTTELRAEVKSRVSITSADLRPLRNRNDFSIDQVIRNIKSHKKQAGNPIAEGLLEEIPRGLRITRKGRELVTGKRYRRG